MPRRLSAAVATAVVLVLQLVLGLADSACMARMAGAAAGAVSGAPSGDMAACDDPAGQEQQPGPGEREQSPPGGERAPAICHALATCGVSYLGAASCDAHTTERTLDHDAVFTVAALTSVAFPPDSPPPRA